MLLFHGSLVLILLCPGCLSLRSGCALSFLAAALGAGGEPKCMGTEGGCCVPEEASGWAVGVMAAWGHHGRALPMAWTCQGRFWKAAWFLLTRCSFKIVPWNKAPALASCWSPGLNRPLLLRQFKCFYCWTIFSITSGYSFIPIDWAQYLGGEPRSHSLCFLLFTPSNAIRFLLAWLLGSLHSTL